MPTLSVEELKRIMAEEKKAIGSAGVELTDAELEILSDELDYLLGFFMEERTTTFMVPRYARAVVRAAMIAKNAAEGVAFGGMSPKSNEFGFRLVTPMELLGKPTWEVTPSAAGEADHIGSVDHPLVLDKNKGVFAIVVVGLGNYGEPNATMYKFYVNREPATPWLYIEKFMRVPYGELKIFPLPAAIIYDAINKKYLNTKIYYSKANVVDETFPFALIFASEVYLRSIPSQLPTA